MQLTTCSTVEAPINDCMYSYTVVVIKLFYYTFLSNTRFHMFVYVLTLLMFFIIRFYVFERSERSERSASEASVLRGSEGARLEAPKELV